MSSEKTTNCPVPLNENDEEYEYEISGDNIGGYAVCVKLVSSEEKDDKADDTSSVSDRSSEASHSESAD